MAAGSDPGPGVDAAGRPVIDPTQNVLDLVQAAIQRQDDLREAEARHARELAAMRASYDRELREAESQRIDAIRAVDVSAVQRAAEVASIVAETLRTQVATTAQQAAAGLAAALEPIIKDIADLRRAQYEAQGVKANVVDRRLDLGTLLGALSVVMVLVFGVVSLVVK